MIAIDWGTSSFRAFLIRNGRILDRNHAPDGILSVEPGKFADRLRRAVRPWLEQGESQILMGGMVGSRQGWCETPYLCCPAGTNELAASLVTVPFAGAEARIVPGLQTSDECGVPEVMRGEETQIIGVLDSMEGDATACLPGSHSKWVSIRQGRIAGFTTHMTGEMFAALRGHTILGRMMEDAPVNTEAFRRGVVRSGQSGGLLHHLFGVRTLGLFGELPANQAGSYLSGLVIGHEVAAAAPRGSVHLIGAPDLCELYAAAIEMHGVVARIARTDAAAYGLAAIAEQALWT